MRLDAPTMAAAEQQRLADLSAESDATDVVFVEVLYRGQWVRFDVSAMEARYLNADQLVERYLSPALAAVSLPRDVHEASSSETSASPIGV